LNTRDAAKYGFFHNKRVKTGFMALSKRLVASDRPRCVGLSADKGAFSAEQKVLVIHGAANLDAKMHVCKSFLLLYAFIVKMSAFIRWVRIAIRGHVWVLVQNEKRSKRVRFGRQLHENGLESAVNFVQGRADESLQGP
jgi:hypothetical protein